MDVTAQHNCSLEAAKRLTTEDGRTRLASLAGDDQVTISFCPWCGEDLRQKPALFRRRADPLKLRD